MSVNGITFDGLHSYTDFGLWLAERPDKGSPEPKLNTLEISGADGIIDLTEANAGEVKFSNRTMKFLFSAMVDIPDQAAFEAQVMNALHGKVVQQIVLDEDPDWYYNGRVRVSFRNIKPWKLQCEITVDAAPYAMAMEDTLIDLTTGEAQPHIVHLATNVRTPTSFFSDFYLGTREFPTGLPTNNQQSMTVGWFRSDQYMPDDSYPRNIQIADSDGHIYNYPFTFADIAPRNFVTIDYSTLTSAGLDIAKVYRVLVQNISNCTLTTTVVSRKHTIQNARKTVVPDFAMVSGVTTAVSINVNGTDYVIETGVHTYPEIILRHGENEVYIPNLPADVTSFEMRFREGKL